MKLTEALAPKVISKADRKLLEFAAKKLAALAKKKVGNPLIKAFINYLETSPYDLGFLVEEYRLVFRRMFEKLIDQNRVSPYLVDDIIDSMKKRDRKEKDQYDKEAFSTGR